MNEADWITAAVLHERYLNDVFRYVSRRVPRREEAEDITAEVFAAAFQALPRFRGECPPRLWLLGIARRKLVDHSRWWKRRRESLLSELADETEVVDGLTTAAAQEEGPEAIVQRAETRRLIRELIGALKEEQREALLLHYVDGLSIAEAATVMGKSPAGVNSLLQRGRAALQRRGRAVLTGEEGVR